MNELVPRRLSIAALAAWRPAVALALGAVSACAMLASTGDAPLSVAGGEVTVNSLDCAADGSVVAAGSLETGSGLEGVVLRSSDRGATWQRATLDPPAPGISLSLVRMPVVREPGTLHASGYRVGTGLFGGQLASSYPPAGWWIAQDGGHAWRRTDAPMPLFPTRDPSRRVPPIVAADASGTLVSVHDHPEPGFFDSDRVVVLRSVDGGRSWVEQLLPQLTDFAVIVADSNGRMAVAGLARDAGAILWSGDSGATWTEAFLPTPASRDLRLYRNPDGTLIAYDAAELEWHGTSTHLYRSDDAGRTWSVPAAFRAGRVVALTGNARGRLVALTSSGIVLVSDDAGRRWRGAANRTIPRSPVEAASMVVAGDGVIVATLDRATFIRSTDWGETWAPVDSGLPDGQYALSESCTDGRGLIVVAGSAGALTRSIDRGATWSAARMEQLRRR
ncbi:MAG: YCF48-related protein [Burkholderiaceae bacterium]